MPHQCFLIEPTEEVTQEITLTRDNCTKGASPNSVCRGETILCVSRQPLDEETAITISIDDAMRTVEVPCKNCGVPIQRAIGNWHLSASRRYRRTDTGDVRDDIHSFGIGAMWYCTWWKRDDDSNLYGWDWDNLLEPPLCVSTPGGEWMIDSRASNCDQKNERSHRCWIRHGQPPLITVDKRGKTCGAGAGSIAAGTYHGFLQNGFLT